MSENSSLVAGSNEELLFGSKLVPGSAVSDWTSKSLVFNSFEYSDAFLRLESSGRVIQEDGTVMAVSGTKKRRMKLGLANVQKLRNNKDLMEL
ncbi:hypothetical protein V6N13_014946 [Hibiscus sabdariffa]|uniref:Uncharacterized protein n=1 Tax=Hibiscus sabdariffa TaxID=183260 RepID=A0ABR2RWX0_9ROSI